MVSYQGSVVQGNVVRHEEKHSNSISTSTILDIWADIEHLLSLLSGVMALHIPTVMLLKFHFIEMLFTLSYLLL